MGTWYSFEWKYHNLFCQYNSYFGKIHFWKLNQYGGLCYIASAASEAGFIPDNANISQDSLKRSRQFPVQLRHQSPCIKDQAESTKGVYKNHKAIHGRINSLGRQCNQET